MLRIKNLKVNIENIEIIKGIDLEVKPGEIHAIMGPNGCGKSTLSKTIAGHPLYKVVEGEISYNGININELDPESRSHLGIFLGFQSPVEIPGVSNEDFLRFSYNSKLEFEGKEKIDPISFLKLVMEKADLIQMQPEFLSRNVNEGFSGGEKKKNEILQMAILDSSLCILDEMDSGLDIDALKIISEAINKIFSEGKSLILITHYNRLLDYVKPNYIHIMKNGKIIKTGDINLARMLEKNGYESIFDG